MAFTSASLVPTKCFLTSGIGVHRERLSSFEMALRDARIAKYNLVNVSSIFPAGCQLIERDRGVGLLQPGQIVFSVMARADTNEPSRLIASSIGLAIPKDPGQFGYLSEHHAYGETEEHAGNYAEDLAASMLATILGLPFDPDAAWDEQREEWRLSGKIVRTTNITCAVEGPLDGRWATVIAAALFCA
ncbi:MAG: pyruvoyl-dependent arginine decarboxylase [Gemmatimonadota bacterium]